MNIPQNIKDKLIHEDTLYFQTFTALGEVDTKYPIFKADVYSFPLSTNIYVQIYNANNTPDTGITIKVYNGIAINDKLHAVYLQHILTIKESAIKFNNKIHSFLTGNMSNQNKAKYYQQLAEKEEQLLKKPKQKQRKDKPWWEGYSFTI